MGFLNLQLVETDQRIFRHFTNYLIMESGKIVAVLNQSETTQDHEMMVDDTKLKETKVLDHLIREGEEDPYQTTLVHTRWINDNFYKVEDVTEDGKVTGQNISTSLNDDQVEAFHQEWESKWKPVMDGEQQYKNQKYYNT